MDRESDERKGVLGGRGVQRDEYKANERQAGGARREVGRAAWWWGVPWNRFLAARTERAVSGRSDDERSESTAPQRRACTSSRESGPASSPR